MIYIYIWYMNVWVQNYSGTYDQQKCSVPAFFIRFYNESKSHLHVHMYKGHLRRSGPETRALATWGSSSSNRSKGSHCWVFWVISCCWTSFWDRSDRFIPQSERCTQWRWTGWTQHGWMVVADETNHNNMCIIVYLYIYIRYTMSHIHIQGSYGVSCPQQPKSAANPLNWINPGVRCTSPHVSCLLTKFLAVLSG